VSDAETRLRVAVAGASGLIGAALCDFLETGGCTVLKLVRRPALSGSEIAWDPETDSIDAAALASAAALVHLGGVNIAAGRWTARRKAAIRDSRVNSTRLLSRTLAQPGPRPRTFVCASAIGYYGDRGDEELTEESPPGAGFLPDLCQEWEAATEPARQAGVRVVNLRIGIVLTAGGGALRRMLPAFRRGLGGVVGSGRQYMSWIALHDLVRAIAFVLRNGSLHGAVNATAPHPVTNRQFTQTLGRVLGRPTCLPLPAPLVRLLLGEMGAALLLAGARVLPTRLLRAGFVFAHPHLEEALRAALAAPAGREEQAPGRRAANSAAGSARGTGATS